MKKSKGEENNAGQNHEHRIDLVADDSDEDFSPLTLSHLISDKNRE